MTFSCKDKITFLGSFVVEGTRKARKAQFFSAKKLLQYIRSYSSQCSGRRLSSWLTRPSTSSKSTHTYSCSLGAPRQQQPGIFYYLSRDQKSSSQTKVSDGLEEPQKYDAFGQQTMKSRDENAEKRPQPQQPSWLIILAYVSHLDFRQQMLTTIENYQRISENIREYWRIWKNIREYWRIWKNIREYQRISENIYDYRKLSKTVKNVNYLQVPN